MTFLKQGRGSSTVFQAAIISNKGHKEWCREEDNTCCMPPPPFLSYIFVCVSLVGVCGGVSFSLPVCVCVFLSSCLSLGHRVSLTLSNWLPSTDIPKELYQTIACGRVTKRETTNHKMRKRIRNYSVSWKYRKLKPQIFNCL